MRLFRYRRQIQWHSERPVMGVVMLHPLYVDRSRDDGLCSGLAARNGFGGVLFVSLVPRRARWPKELLADGIDLGCSHPEQLQALREAAELTDVVCAWGPSARRLPGVVAAAAGVLREGPCRLHFVGPQRPDGAPRAIGSFPRKAELVRWG